MRRGLNGTACRLTSHHGGTLFARLRLTTSSRRKILGNCGADDMMTSHWDDGTAERLTIFQRTG
jgi:hypothetical protein